MNPSTATSSSTVSATISTTSSSNTGKITSLLLLILIGIYLFASENVSFFNNILSVQLPWNLPFHGIHPTLQLIDEWPRHFSQQWTLLSKAYPESLSIPLHDYRLTGSSATTPSRIYSLRKSTSFDKFSSVVETTVLSTPSKTSSNLRTSSPQFTVSSSSSSSSIINPQLLLVPLNLSSLGSHVQCERIPVIRNMNTFPLYVDEGVYTSSSSSASIPRILIAVTTCNYHKTTQRFLNYSEYNTDYMDIVLFDDASKRYEELYRLALEYGAVAICRNTRRLGLISMLNVAWRFFKYNLRYRYMLLASNDIVIPQSSAKELIRVFEQYPTKVSLLAPLSTPLGLGPAANSHYLNLNVLHWYPHLRQQYNNKDIEHPPDQASIMQEKMVEYLEQKNDNSIPDILAVEKGKTFLAFIMGMNRGLIKYERPNEYKWDETETEAVDYLWSSGLITTGAESGLQNAGVQPYIALRSYVWHRKGSTAHDSMGAKRDSLELSCNDERESV